MRLLRFRVAADRMARKVLAGSVRQAPGAVSRLADYAERFAIAARHAAAQRHENQGAGVLPGRTLGTDFLTDLSRLGRADAGAGLVRLLDRHGVLTDNLFYFYLSRLLANRNIELLAELVADEALGRPDVRTYYAARLAHHQGTTGPSAKELLGLLDRANAIIPAHQVVDLVLEQLVRDDDIDGLEAFIEGHLALSLQSAKDNTMLGCLRSFVKHGRIEKGEALLRARLKELPRERQLLFLDVAQALHPGGLPGAGLSAGCGWRGVLADFKTAQSARSTADAALIRERLLAPLEALPRGEQDFVDIRMDADAATRLLGVVRAAVESRRPCALVRLGDGEAYAYSHHGLGFAAAELFLEDNRLRERHWWGLSLIDRRRDAIARGVREAVKTCDILGIPSIYRIIRDNTSATQPFGTLAAHRGLAVVLNALDKDIPLAGKLLTEERCHQVLFSDQVFRELSEAADKTIVVSCWRADQLGCDLEGDVDVIQVAPHAKIAAADAQDQPLCMTYEETVSRIREAAGPGSLVLVGAGIIGKIFVGAAREKGAVALDVGSMLDYAAGYKTRGIADIV